MTTPMTPPQINITPPHHKPTPIFGNPVFYFYLVYAICSPTACQCACGCYLEHEPQLLLLLFVWSHLALICLLHREGRPLSFASYRDSLKQFRFGASPPAERHQPLGQLIIGSRELEPQATTPQRYARNWQSLSPPLLPLLNPHAVFCMFH